MAAKMLCQCTVVAVVVGVGLAAAVHGQQLYAGPGAVVQGRVQGPFVQQVNPYALPGPPSYSPFPAPRVYVPAPGPYLYGPVIVPPGYGYRPHAYRPGLMNPYGRTPQPYQGYQPRSSPPRFADPYASPMPQGGQVGAGFKSAPTEAGATKPQSPTSLKDAKPDKEAAQKVQDRTAKGRARSLKDTKAQTPPAEPNKPVAPVHKPAVQPRAAKP
ncbi:MAG: hypothetical protein A2Y77_14760 [Planctomycetes bacterium RBG_13_62_9]|nr:MAG: hypothetical protein A2Y77_14760 [Planctomycetes bacterium RBG_13_62_9]